MSLGGSHDSADGPRHEVTTPDVGWRAELARQWAAKLNTLVYIPMSRPVVERRLRDLVDLIVGALEAPSDLDKAGRVVGSRLVEMHVTGDESLSRSLELLRDRLVEGPENEPARRILALLTAVASGYAGADRESTFAQQETLKRALLRSKLRTERELRVSEDRFREMFSTTPVGVAICDLGGTFVEVNSALVETLGYSEQELRAMTIHDLFHPQEAAGLSVAYSEIAQGSRQQLRERRDLIRADGEAAWSYLAVSVLRDADGAPRQFVTMVEDLRELSSLQERVRDQSLHDDMTGLPNRRFFRTRLEAALVNLPQDATLTLYHLGLEAFEIINNGLGYEVGDSVVKAVAHRLESLVEGEEGMVARLGGTEFAILLKQSPHTPEIGQFVTLINDVLSEPVYIDDDGIATSASIGVIQRRVADGSCEDMMWGADVALRRAETSGRRQWALFDPDRAPQERIEARLAAVLPGELELGELELCYRPLVSTEDRGVVGLEARVRWHPDGHDELGHDECLRLAERSGVTLSLRDWMLRTAWKRTGAWHAAGHRPRLVVGLSPNQARDPDLVARVYDVLEAVELDACWMRLCIPMAAMTGSSDEARENMFVLDSMGVQTALHDFRASPEELRCLRELPVHTVQLASDLVRTIHDRETVEAPEVRALTSVLPLIRECGAPVVVDGIDTEERADRWRRMGCEVGAGPLYGDLRTAEDVPDLLERP